VIKALSIFCLTSLFSIVALGQATPDIPNESGMYVEAQGHPIKVIGQIAEFKRSGSLLVHHVTGGLKTEKENIQLLGAHAQTVVTPQPTFYFVPAKQEAEAGVNAGDLILIRLEEKSERRQFEIAARGAWRSSSGISLTHQVQLLRSEVKPGIYRVTPATELSRGEYALYLARGEGMAPYVYDFGVGTQSRNSIAPQTTVIPNARDTDHVDAATFASTKLIPRSEPSRQFSQSTIGVFSEGNPDVRRDGVLVAAVNPGGPADQAGIKAGDAILAVNDHYVFTANELKSEIGRYQPGGKVGIRFRRYSTIYDAAVVVGQLQ